MEDHKDVWVFDIVGDAVVQNGLVRRVFRRRDNHALSADRGLSHQDSGQVHMLVVLGGWEGVLVLG